MRIGLVCLLLISMGCAPKAKLLDAPIAQNIQQGIKQGTQSFDHRSYDQLLQKHIHVDPKTKLTRVDYKGLKQDRAVLDAYLQSLAKADLKQYGRDALMALLINAYNAYTLSLIVAHEGQIKSIRDIDNPWKQAKYQLGGATVSLDNIEHNLLRPIFKDPRIHFAVNCASIGCPPIYGRAFTGAQLAQQLDTVTKTTLTSTAYVRIEDQTLKLNAILNWYGKDFTNPSFKGHAKSVPSYVAKYGNDDVRAFVKKHQGNPPTKFLDYDWALNSKK